MDVTTQLKRLGASDDMIRGALCNGRPISECDRTTSNTVTAGRFESPGLLRIVVPGPAPGKPRMNRGDKWKKRPCVMRYRAWCDLVRSIAGEVPAAESVEALNWVAYYEPPMSWSKKKRCSVIGEQYRSKPDASNVLKGLEDCLWPDGDQALARGQYAQRWDWHARLEIEIVLGGAK